MLPMKAAMMTVTAMLLLAACGPKSAGEATADNLHNAADQSDPAAAQVLDKAADNISDVRTPAMANAMANDAMQAAGNAQTATPPQPQ
jgi:predicted NBD/HSP70 family sugar kinase